MVGQQIKSKTQHIERYTPISNSAKTKNLNKIENQLKKKSLHQNYGTKNHKTSPLKKNLKKTKIKKGPVTYLKFTI